MPTRIAYLGPAGTYGEQASRALADLEGLSEVSFLPCAGLRAVVECLAQAGADAAVVPVENSVEGGVTATLDALWAHPTSASAAPWCCRSVMPCWQRIVAGRHGSAVSPSGPGAMFRLAGRSIASGFATAHQLHG